MIPFIVKFTWDRHKNTWEEHRYIYKHADKIQHDIHEYKKITQRKAKLKIKKKNEANVKSTYRWYTAESTFCYSEELVFLPSLNVSYVKSWVNAYNQNNQGNFRTMCQFKASFLFSIKIFFKYLE